MLRLMERTDRIHHLPRILDHWRKLAGRPYPSHADRSAAPALPPGPARREASGGHNQRRSIVGRLKGKGMSQKLYQALMLAMSAIRTVLAAITALR